jgi:membrane associated rhomboid family serine protease
MQAEMKRYCPYVLPALWIVLYVLTDARLMGYNRVSPLYTHVTYLFSHAGVFHLAVNLVAFFYAFRLCERLGIIREALFASFLSAIPPTFVMPQEVVTVGASGMIYAMFVSPLAGVMSGRLAVRDKRVFARFYVCLSVCTGVQPMLSGNVNVTVHVLSPVINIAVLFFYWKLKCTMRN